MDALSDILGALRVRGSVYFCDYLRSPWELRFDDEPCGIFHVLRRGRALFESGDMQQHLEAGDFVFIGPGQSHRLSIEDPGGQETLMLCGYCEFATDGADALLRYLPDTRVLQGDQLDAWPWLRRTLEHLSAEYQSDAPGSQLTVDKLTEVLLVQLIRADFGRDRQQGLIAALRDHRIAAALDAIHADPGLPWTTETAAMQASMSRSGFARRFSELLETPFFDYLTRLRMRHARALLRGGQLSVADIGEQIGYRSEPAFVKVFRKHHGQTPRAWRLGAA